MANQDDTLGIKAARVAGGYFGGQISCITDRCQIKKQSLGGQTNSFQDVAWSTNVAEAEKEGSTKKGINTPVSNNTGREEWNVRREVVICTASIAC